MKKMTGVLVLLATVAGFAVAGGVEEAASSKGAHYPANNCEIFIDKISANASSHAYRGVNIWIKTLNSRLDSEIAEVGFRHKTAGYGYSSGPISEDWRNEKMRPFMGSRDYYSISLNVSSDFAWTTFEGAFYVRTTAGTNYWLKPAGGGNFVFDANSYKNISNAMGYNNYSSDVSAAISTQRADLGYYNPGRCN